jgi:hypothetical protein
MGYEFNTLTEAGDRSDLRDRQAISGDFHERGIPFHETPQLQP